MSEQVSDGAFERLFIDHPFYDVSPQTLALEIERVVKENGMNYLEAAAHLCERYEFDYAVMAKMLTPTMIEKIEMAAIDRNMFRKIQPPSANVEFQE
jgi:Phage late-transcription coactivator